MFRCKPDWNKVDWDSRRDDPHMTDPYLKALALDERGRLVSRLQNTLSHPDSALQFVRKITYADQWRPELIIDRNIRLQPWGWLANISPEFRVNFEALLCHLFESCSNLHTIRFISTNLHDEFLHTLLACPTLHTLELTDSTVNVHILESNDHSRFVDALPSIVNLTMGFSTISHITQWSMLGFCPQLLYLKIHGSFHNFEGGTRLPAANFRARINPFATIERLVLTNIPQRSIAALASWLDAVPCPHLSLTHLSITLVHGGARRESIFTLLDALAYPRAPHMRVLYIDGLLYARPDLIARIASACPALETLVLIYWGQKRPEAPSLPIPWPLPSYEYVPAFAGFRNLKHFGWNFRFEKWDHTSRSLVFLEESIGKIELDDDWLFRIDRDENAKSFDLLGDDNTFARYLATTVPTLETLSTYPRPLSDNSWIQRGEDGRVIDVKVDKDMPAYVYLSMDEKQPEGKSTRRCWKFSLTELANRERNVVEGS